MLILIFVIVIGIIVFTLVKNGRETSSHNPQPSVVDSQEFQTALIEAKRIKQFFSDTAARKGGTVRVVKWDIDHPETIDYSREDYNPLVYFRVCLDYGYSHFLSLIQDYRTSAEEQAKLRDQYLLDVFGMNTAEIEAAGLDPYDIAGDMQKGDSACEGILYYKFLCPCGLKGEKRDIFIKMID